MTRKVRSITTPSEFYEYLRGVSRKYWVTCQDVRCTLEKIELKETTKKGGVRRILVGFKFVFQNAFVKRNKGKTVVPPLNKIQEQSIMEFVVKCIAGLNLFLVESRKTLTKGLNGERFVIAFRMPCLPTKIPV